MRWKRTIGWILAGLLALLLIVAVGGYFYLKSNGFQQYAISKIIEQTTLATGGKTELQHLDFDLSTLTAHLYNVTIHGKEGPGRPPLLQADELTVRLGIQSVLHHKITLREILLEHPVLHVQVNRDGQNNLPEAPPSQSGSQTNVFDLAVGHVQLTNGEIDYNDRKTPLEADLFDLGTEIRFESLAKRYRGTISYDNGRIRYAQFSPLGHNLVFSFNATPDRLTVESADLKVGTSEILLRAGISNYSNPVADGDYEIRLHAQDFASMSPGTAPAGDVSLIGKLHYQAAGNQPLLRSISVSGQIASQMLSAAASGSRIQLHQLAGRYQLANGTLQITDVKLNSLGGHLTGDAEIQHLDGTPASRVRTSLHGISLGALQQTLRTSALRGAVLSGTLNGTADASWKGSVSNIRAHSDLRVRAAASKATNPSGSEVPVNGAIHLTYDEPRNTLVLRDTAFQIPSATLTAHGEISDHSSLQIQMSASDLHQLAALAASFRPTQSGPPAVSGTASLTAIVHGSMQNPHIAAQLQAQNLQVQGSEWTTAKLNIEASPSRFLLQNGSLVSARRGQASFNASVSLRHWVYQPSNPIKASLSVKQMRVADLQQVVGQHYPISGELSAEMSIGGSQDNPAGSGSAQIVNARAYDEPIENLTLKFHADNGSIASTLNLATAAGGLNTNLTYTPRTKAYKVRIEAPSVVLQRLQTVQAKNLLLTGTVSASVNGEGTLDNPQLAAVVQLPELQLRQSLISGLRAEVRVAEHRVDLSLDSKVSQASVRAHGRVDLTGDYYAEAAIDTSTVPLDLLMATYAHGAPPGFQGQTEMHATLKGPLKDKSQVEAHLTIPTLNASYQSLQIGIANPIHADYANSIVTLQPAEIRGTGTSLRAQGKIPIAGTASPTLTAQGSVDVRVLRIVAPDLQSSGILTLDVRTSGAATNPVVEGQMRLKDVALSTADAPLGIENLNGTLDIGSERVQISKMSAQVGGGQVSVGGSIGYRPSLQYNVAVQSKSVRLRYPEGLRVLLDSSLAFSGTKESSTLNGRVLIDNLSFTPDFDLAKFADQFSTGTTTPSQPGFADTVGLAIGVDSTDSLNAVSSQISIAGRVALQVSGTAANPVITGRTNLTSGELFYRNVRYQLQQGVITFDDPNETHPVMNVAVTTTVEQYNLKLNMRGPLDKLTTSYASDPPLATADIINLIARGKTTQEANATSPSTDSMIASQAASQVSGGLQKLAGISSLQIDPLIGGNNQNPSARVAIQQRVTKNLLFTFSTDVSQPGSEMVQGEYQINKRWSISMARDQVGGVSVDGKYHTKF
jgi:translocation and assembly module TamB